MRANKNFILQVALFFIVDLHKTICKIQLAIKPLIQTNLCETKDINLLAPPKVEIVLIKIGTFDDVNDERRNFNYINSVNGRRLSSKYTNQFGDVPLIRLAEMYLIRAEANLQAATTVGDTPLNDINRLRTRAKATLFTTVTLANILRERELELGMEGFRIHDIKRTKGSISSSYAWDSDLLVFPIPLRETNVNTLITQNPEY